MSLVLNGTDGLSDVDGSAATPAIRGTDANTGIFFPAADTIAFAEGGTEVMRIDSSGNLGLGVTPSAWTTNFSVRALQLGGGSVYSYDNNRVFVGQNVAITGAGSDTYVNTAAASAYRQFQGSHAWFTAPSGTAGNAISFTQAMTLDASGNLLVGTTSSGGANRLVVESSGSGASAVVGQVPETTGNPFVAWNKGASGNNNLVLFGTDSAFAIRGSITYNRGAGLVAYNTTSDYRAKDIIGPVTDSGALIDSVPVYMGKMKGATQERPMFIAHETPAYAHTGEKDAVDKDGKPVYQQMDASALVPVMWAEIQSLRQRLAALESN